MRRKVLTLFALLCLATPVTAGEESRWVAFIRGDTDSFTGSLEVVRTDGEGARTLLDQGVRSVDLGPGGAVFAVQEKQPTGDGLAPSTLLEIPAEQGEPSSVFGEDRTAHPFAVSASAEGHVAVARLVPRSSDPPEHLAPAIDRLRVTDVPVLAPPEEPPDTRGVVADADVDFYELRFTNDPKGKLSHTEQVNVFVRAVDGREEDENHENVQPATVRGKQGRYFCGAATCFLTWRQHGVTYTVGEFSDQEAAVSFANSLRPIEELAGFLWRDELGYPLPELMIRRDDGERVTLEQVTDFCECSFTPVDWSADGSSVLVITAAEGYTTLQEYAADGTGRPETLTESSVFEGGQIIDAGYGPDGVMVALAGEGGPPGRLQTIEGDRVVKGKVRAFDVAGSTLAYVTGKGEVRIRDMGSGTERAIASGAIDVALAPDVLTARTEGPVAEDDGPPVVLVVLIGVAGAALVAGAVMLGIARAKR